MRKFLTLLLNHLSYVTNLGDYFASLDSTPQGRDFVCVFSSPGAVFLNNGSWMGGWCIIYIRAFLWCLLLWFCLSSYYKELVLLWVLGNFLGYLEGQVLFQLHSGLTPSASSMEAFQCMGILENWQPLDILWTNGAKHCSTGTQVDLALVLTYTTMHALFKDASPWVS